VSGTHVTLFVDCLKLYEQNIQTIDPIPPSSNVQLYVGQLNRQHALFRVSYMNINMIKLLVIEKIYPRFFSLIDLVKQIVNVLKFLKPISATNLLFIHAIQTF
jgi:hypothetical protein